MEKKGLTLVGFLIVILICLVGIIVGTVLTLIFPYPDHQKEPGPTYQITTLWEDKESGRAEFYVEGLIEDPNTGHTFCLSQAKRKIEADGYDLKIIPALYEGAGERGLRDIWVIAERKK